MRGRILNYSVSKGEGVITTEQDRRFVFSSSEWKEKELPERGMKVDFDANQSGKAVEIYLALSDKSDASPIVYSEKTSSHIWVSIVALIVSLLALLALFDDGYWDQDMIMGWGLFVTASLAAGIVVITNGFAGKGLAIAAVVISSLSLILGVGLLAG